MLTVLEIVVPIFAVLGIGFAAVYLNLFSAAANAGLTRFVFNFAIPVLLFKVMATAQLPAQPPWNLFLGYYASVAVIFSLAVLLARHWRWDIAEQGVYGFAAAYSNMVLLGIPLILTAFGDTAAVPLFLIITFHPILMFPVIITFVEAGRQREQAGRRIARSSLAGLVRSPIVVAMALGLLVNALSLPLPAPALQFADLFGAAATPCALFALGATLAGLGITTRPSPILLVLLLKNVLHPLLAWWFLTSLGVDATWRAVAVIVAAMPTGVHVFLFAERYGVNVQLACSAVFLSFTVSLVTLPVALYLLL